MIYTLFRQPDRKCFHTSKHYQRIHFKQVLFLFIVHTTATNCHYIVTNADFFVTNADLVEFQK